jgi:protoheme IX farnesyltransferase
MTNRNHHTILGAAAATWAFLGWSGLLLFAIARLSAIAAEALRQELTALQLTALLGNVAFMAWAEGYRGFQQRFSPRAAARVLYLRANATLLTALLAPFFCVGYLGAPPRRVRATWVGTALIGLMIVIIHQVPQPWRGITDAGVVVGLSWGFVSFVVLTWRALRAGRYPAAPEVPGSAWRAERSGEGSPYNGPRAARTLPMVMTETLTLIYHAAKVRLGFLIAACAVAGVAMSPGPGLAAWRLTILGIAVLLCSAAAGAFNQFYERNLDGSMTRTQTRPFVTGRFRADWIWASGIGLALTIGLLAVAWATNVAAMLWVFLGAFTYGVVYTVWLKRRTWLNIVIGGLSGSFAVMAGSAAVGATLEPAPLILAIVLFLWTPPHFWALAFACKRDYQKAGVPMLPAVVSDRVSTRAIFGHALALVLLSGLPVFFGMGWIYFVGAAVGGAYFVRSCWQLLKRPTVPQGWRVFAASIVQLGLLLTMAILDRVLLS